MKRRTVKFITVLLSVLLLSSVMVAKPNSASAVFGTLGAYYPAAAYDPEFNRYLVVYQDVQYVDPDYQYYIYGQFVRLDGVPVGAPFQISEAGNSHHGPSIARGYDGRFLVVWDATSPAPVDIVGQFVNPDGTLEGPNFVISNAACFKMHPKVASSPNYNRFLVIWDDDRNWETSGTDIYGQLVDEDGSLPETASDENFAVSNAFESQFESNVAYDSTNGRFMVVWVDYRNQINHIYGQLVNADWDAVSPRGAYYLTASDENFPISTEPTENRYWPSVAFDGNNNRFLVVWQDCRSGFCYDIYGQLVNGYYDGVDDILDYYGGDPEVNQLLVDGAADIADPSIAKDDCNNGFLLAWSDYRSGSRYDIYGAHLNEDGSLKDTDFVIFQSAYDASIPSVAVNGNCGALVTFERREPSINILGLIITGGLSDIIVSPSPVDFGDVTVGNSSTPQEITIQNDGNADLTVTSFVTLGTDAGMFDVVAGGSDPCGQFPVVLAPGLSCTMDAIFTPTSGGVKTATLRIYSNDPETPSADVTLNGSGLTYTKVTVLSPNGGDLFATGQPVPISWEAPAAAVKFKVFYSLDNGVTWVVITKDYITQKSHGWTAPLLTANKKSCLVKVVGYKNNGVLVGSDRSNAAFTIEVVKLTYPDGGNTLYSGDTETVTWTVNETKKPVTSIKLYYTKNNGTTWTLIKKLDGSAVEHEWTVPTVAAPKTKCKVKIVLMSVTGVNLGSDVSDAVFTITNVH